MRGPHRAGRRRAGTACRPATTSCCSTPTAPRALAPLALAAAGIAGVLPQLLEAYRTGGGVPYAAYGADFRDGQAGFNRPAFVNLLADDWLAAVSRRSTPD